MCNAHLAFCTSLALPQAHSSPPRVQHRRTTPRCGSLEESRKRARSVYDNIPNLNELYLRELRTLQRQGAAPPDADGLPPKLPLRPDTPGAVARRRELEDPEGKGGRDAEAIAAAREKSLLAYANIRKKLVSDTVFVGVLACSAAWAVSDVASAASVAVGCGAGLAYVFLLARGVDRMGSFGDALAPARAAILALAVIGAAKNRDVLRVLPVMCGFFTYKVATVLPLITGEAFEET